MNRKIKVVELFAGVGGFRLAAEKSSNCFEFIWSNQWEPSSKIQHAYNCYINHYGESPNHSNEDISMAKTKIPKNFDLLVGGFPCQDYSVATTNAKGITGKKGVLWWEIDWILKNRNPKMVLLENVDRLLKSPVNQRGRDFAIILRCFYESGYDVEWMVNNGADYGFSQRRKRVFIFAIKRNKKNTDKLIFNKSFSFKTNPNSVTKFEMNEFKNLLDISDNYEYGKFREYGKLIDNLVESYSYISDYVGEYKTLGDVLIKDWSKDLILNDEQILKMTYYKGSKKILRTKPNGDKYFYSEGSMKLIDDINKSSRTMLTSEAKLNRSTHLIKSGKNIRFLDPVETERLNGFYDNWTQGMPTSRRYFCMGNALLVDLVKIIFDQIIKI